MRLEPVICRLLLDHDCVVLPDFGGLVANYRPARLNHRTHVISPPSKHIGFNRSLKKNDGLLAGHLSHTLGIQYNDAVIKIKECVNDYHKSLRENGRLVLEKIGVFFNDQSGQLQFIPEEQENFLLSSFGLRPVQLKYVEQIEEKPETPIIPINDTRRKTAGWKIAAAIGIPLLLAGSLLLRSQIKSNEDFTLASLNPFHQVRVDSDYALNQFEFNKPGPALQNPLASALDTVSGNFKYDFLHNKISEAGIEIENTIKEIAQPISTEVKPESDPKEKIEKVHVSSGRFAVIGGAFAVQENAEKFMDKLIADGYDAALAGKKDGLQLVAYGYYASRAEAVDAMRKIKSSGSSAWIHRSKN